MTDDKNAMDDLLANLGRRKQNAPPSPAASRPKALSPLDVLTMPLAKRQVVNYLSRRRTPARLVEIERRLKALSKADIEQAIHSLKTSSYIRESLVNGEIAYRVVFGGLTSRIKLSVPTDIWSRLSVDNVTFLQQMSMFRGVSHNDLRALTARMTTHYYRRNEVIVWQGESSDDAYLIKNGIVGISYLSPDRKSSQTLAYLKQGDILGEIGVLQNQVRSATATALSNVETLVIKRDQFLNMLEKYDAAALELARILGRQLVATSARMVQSDTNTRLILVFRVGGDSGGTTIASALASTLAHETKQATVYTEYPDPSHLPNYFGFTADLYSYHHPAGYDVYLPQVDPSLPEVVDLTLMLDRLLSNYTNIVIGLPDEIDEGALYMLDRVSQVVLIVPPNPAAWEQLKKLRADIKEHILTERASLLTVINRPRPEDKDKPAPGQADFDLPFLGNLPPGQDESVLPAPLLNLTKTMMNRLGRTSEISVYIPTTIDVNQQIDATPYVKKTLAFMGKQFGGATSSQAEGMWHSDEVGLVNETVYVVRSFVTPDDVHLHLDPLLEYVAKLKKELRQEAIAIEVDRKLMMV